MLIHRLFFLHFIAELPLAVGPATGYAVGPVASAPLDRVLPVPAGTKMVPRVELDRPVPAAAPAPLVGYGDVP